MQTVNSLTIERKTPYNSTYPKGGFRAPQTVLWLIKHQFFKSSFVVKVTPFGQLQNVSRNTETLRYKFIFLIISIIFTSCQKENIDEINVVNNWNIKRDPYTSGQLVLNENKTFHFTERSHLSETFSNGVWKMKDDTIYLNSKMHNECLYMNSFKPYCEDKYIVTREKIETTIENCQPKNYTRFYTIFQNEKFKFRNDSLFYVNPNKNCANKQSNYEIYR